MKTGKNGTKALIILTICLVVIMTLGITVVLYVIDYYRADEYALNIMSKTDTNVSVLHDEEGYIVFEPENPVAGLIFYPGGKVQCEAYAPLMMACAERNILCILVRMPANLAVLNKDAADGLQDLYPSIGTWFMGGHSLGGAMAASYVSEHIAEYDGLILLAAYSTANISTANLDVLSMYGSEDRVLDMDKYTENKANLPADVSEILIEGGCHAYFGSYGNQDGDGTPSISKTEQIERTANAIASMLE